MSHSCKFKHHSDNTYDAKTNLYVTFKFKNYTFTLPNVFMHYLDDAGSHGWQWKPPQEFIDAMMKDGELTLSFMVQPMSSIVLANVDVENDIPYEMGSLFLKKGESEVIGYLMPLAKVMTDYLIHTQPAQTLKEGEEFPAGFLDRMRFIHEKVAKHTFTTIIPPLKIKFHSIHSAWESTACALIGTAFGLAGGRAVSGWLGARNSNARLLMGLGALFGLGTAFTNPPGYFDTIHMEAESLSTLEI